MSKTAKFGEEIQGILGVKVANLNKIIFII
jgi:hypothetical protein